MHAQHACATSRGPPSAGMHDDGSVTDSERPLSRSSSGSLWNVDFAGLASPTRTAVAAGNDAVPGAAGYVEHTRRTSTSCRRRRSKHTRSMPEPANWEAAWGITGVTAVKAR